MEKERIPTAETNEPEVPAEPEAGKEDAITLLTRELAALKELVDTKLSEPTPGELPARDSRGELAAMEEFRALYPDTSAADIPDEVWTSVDSGIPLAAAYALWTRREELRRQSAAAINRKNAESWGRAQAAGDGDDLTPAEVRAMSPEQVRRNYSRIVASMKHW